MTKKNGTSNVPVGDVACAAGAQPTCSGHARHDEAAAAKNADFKAVRLPERRAILGLMRLNFLSVDFSKYAKDIGIYRAVLNGDIVYIGKATELNNGGFRKRLRDYTRESPSARNYPAGELIFSNRNDIHIDIILFNRTLDSIPDIVAMEIELINTANPPWNRYGRK